MFDGLLLACRALAIKLTSSLKLRENNQLPALSWLLWQNLPCGRGLMVLNCG